MPCDWIWGYGFWVWIWDTGFGLVLVEVRDSWMEYSIPVRYGLGVWPDWRVVGTPPSSSSASPGNSGWHFGQGTIFGVFKLDFGSYERYQDFDTGVLHRISSWIYLAEWFGLGSHFGNLLVVGSISKNKMSCFWKTTQKMVSGPNVPRGPKGHSYNIYLAWNGLATRN